ncbi:MAG: DinB family protein [Phycisphaerales bacterium]|nr:DinB family protein [Phycisphaerales bacterium]
MTTSSTPVGAVAGHAEIGREIDALDTPALILRYRRGVENFDPRLFDLADDQIDTAFLPDSGVGRWPVRFLLGHLADAELVMTFRIRRILAEDRPVLAVWDEMAFADSPLYTPGLRQPIAGYLAAIHTLRRWTTELLMALTPEQWSRPALHPERGEITLRDVVVGTTWHLEHHNVYLQAKIDRFLGPRAECAPEEQARGRCGPSCGCHGEP